MTEPAYFWKDNQVVEFDWGVSSLSNDLRDLFCFDADEVEPSQRYGIFPKAKDGRSWIPVLLEDFPKEFRVQLLLLGVPT